MKLLAKVEIPNYIRQVTIAKERKPVYYIKGKKEPKAAKYKSGRYQYKKEVVTKKGKQVVEYHLWDIAVNKKVIANPTTAGKPRIKLINGQELFSRATTKNYTIIKEMDAIKESFIPYVNEMQPINEYPIRILCHVYDMVVDPLCSNMLWDIGNRFIMYGKCFEDVLRGWPIVKKGEITKYKCKRIIEEDHILKITQSPTPLFHPIEKEEDRKLIFFLYKDEREIIKQSKYYGKR